MAGLSTATLLLVAFLIPGALAVWGFERGAGRFGIVLKDRILRLVGTSAVLHAVAAWPLYLMYINHRPTFIKLYEPPWWFWLFPIAYTIGPLALGTLLGYAWKNWRWARLVIGKNRAPRAWDRLFQDEPAGWIICKLKSDIWVGGVYGEENESTPYTSAYPGPQDLYLPAMLDIHPDTGEIHTDDTTGYPIPLQQGILLRWEEIELLQFIKQPEDTNDQ